MQKTLLNFLTEAEFRELVLAVAAVKPPHIYNALFPEKQTPFLTWETVLDENRYASAAPVITFGSSAPLASRKTLNKLTGDMNPIAIKREMDEKLRILIAQPNNQNFLVQEIFDDIKWVTEAIRYRLDFMALQSLSSGKVTLDSDTNADGIEADLDYQLESWQQVGVTNDWSDTSNGTPIANIQTWIQALRDKNINPTRIWMLRKTFTNMINTDEFITNYKNLATSADVQSALLGLGPVNQILVRADLPPIALVDDMIEYQKADGTFDIVKRAWKDNVVSITEGDIQGQTLYAPTAEELVSQKDYYLAKAGFIAVQKYSTRDPIVELTKGKANAFPVWAKSNRVLMANTEDTSF